METFEFLLSMEELQLLDDVAFLEPFLDGILGRAKRRRKGNFFRVRFPEDELRDSSGALLYASGFMKPPQKAEALYALGRKLEKPLPVLVPKYTLRTELG